MDSTHIGEDVDEEAPLLDATRPSEHNSFVTTTRNRSTSLSATPGKGHGSESALWLPLERFQHVFQKMTWSLFLIWMLTSITNIMFGYASTSFSGLQGIPSFAREFGTPSGADGSYTLSASKVSFMSSIGLAGKLFGTLVRTFTVLI